MNRLGSAFVTGRRQAAFSVTGQLGEQPLNRVDRQAEHQPRLEAELGGALAGRNEILDFIALNLQKMLADLKRA